MFAQTSSKVLLALGLVLGAQVAAAHGHEKGPHGGEVKEFGQKYHLEALRKGGEVDIFLLDGEAKGDATASKHGGGTITVVAPGVPAAKIDLPAGGDFSKTEAKAPEKGKVTVLIQLKIDGKPASATFALE